MDFFKSFLKSVMFQDGEKCLCTYLKTSLILSLVYQPLTETVYEFTDTDKDEVSPGDGIHILWSFIQKVQIIIYLLCVLLFQFTYAMLAHIPMDKESETSQEVHWVINIKTHSH